jgi:hypothetical protein
MRALFNVVVTLAALVGLSLTVPNSCLARGTQQFSGTQTHPRNVRYEPNTDKLFRQEDVLSKSLGDPPGGKESYSGNRLRQYRFIGKPGRGGIYDAFGEYHKRIGADPKNYKFRLH